MNRIEKSIGSLVLNILLILFILSKLLSSCVRLERHRSLRPQISSRPYSLHLTPNANDLLNNVVPKLCVVGPPASPKA